jgi:tetratricopeptide (TPR) repeat protein
VGLNRRFEPPRLDGLQADSLASLLQGVSDLGAPPEILCADLSLGAWQSHQVATELAWQLGFALPAPETSAAFDPPSQAFERWVREGYPEELLVEILLDSAESIGGWIDSEALGDRGRRRSLELARRVLGALENAGARTLAVLAPRFGLDWEREDVLLVEWLSRGLETPSRLVIVGAGPCTIPAGWRVRWRSTRSPPQAEPAPWSLPDLVPGLLDSDLCRRFPGGPAEPLLSLAGSRFLVGPERRRAPGQVSRLEYDKLAVVARGRGWLSAYAQWHGHSIHVEPWTLCREAMQRLAEGGEGIALRLQERAASCMTPPVPRGLLQCIAQGWRIALQRYGEASRLGDPSRALPPVLRGALLQTKGWGLTMVGQAAQAEPLLREALELLRPRFEGRREYLYLKNIAALNRVNLGDVAGALAAEREIEAALAALPARDARLEYVNSINLARLHRRRAEFDLAHDCYERAFATTWGLRTDNDLIYGNVCHARLEAARGRHEHALQAWLRAALHWAAADAPEAVGWRTIAAVLGRRAHPDEDVVEALSAALTGVLLEEANAARPRGQIPEPRPEGPVFVRAAELPGPPHALRRIVGGRGWSVIRAEGDAPPPDDGPAARRLRGLLGAMIRCGADGDEGSAPGVVLVDDRLGRELAANPVEMIETAVRLAVPRVRYEAVDIELTPALRLVLEGSVRVSRSPAVDRVLRRNGEASVTFRRYRRPQELTGDEARLLGLVEDETPIELLWRRSGTHDPLPGFVRALRTLESKRVVEIRLTEQACIEHGLLPLREADGRRPPGP